MPNETSPREQREANFAKHVSNDLYKQVQQGGVDAIILIADPQTLGEIRQDLHAEVKKRITGELHKNLTKATIADIDKTLSTALVA